MTRYFTVWKAPRSKGTAITYGLYNGLRAQGYSCVYHNEPLHWRRIVQIEDDPSALEAHLAETCGTRPPDGVDFVIQKRNAKWAYDHRVSPHLRSFDWISGLTNVLLLRDLAAMIEDHQKGLDKSRAPNTPKELTLDVLGIPQLFWIYRYCRDRDIDMPVYDADDLLVDPERGMQTLCNRYGVSFTSEMAKWDSVDLKTPPWGDEWYRELRESRGLISSRRSTNSVNRNTILVAHPMASKFIDGITDRL